MEWNLIESSAVSHTSLWLDSVGTNRKEDVEGATLCASGASKLVRTEVQSPHETGQKETGLRMRRARAQ